MPELSGSSVAAAPAPLSSGVTTGIFAHPVNNAILKQTIIAIMGKSDVFFITFLSSLKSEGYYYDNLLIKVTPSIFHKKRGVLSPPLYIHISIFL